MHPFSKAQFLRAAGRPADLPPPGLPEIAFAGRSNVGKSSAINALTGRRGLARTSKTPGRTQLLNFFELTPGCRVVDLPGYGYAAASIEERASWVSMTTALSRRAALRGLLLVIDSRR